MMKGAMQLIKDNLQLLNKLAQDSKKIDYLYKPGLYWKRLANLACDQMVNYGLRNFRAFPVDENCFVGRAYADAETIEPFWLSKKGRLLKKILNNKLFNKYFISQYERLIKQHYDGGKKYKQVCFSDKFKNLVDDYEKKTPLPVTTIAGCTNTVKIGEKDYSVKYLMNLSYIEAFKNNGLEFNKINSVMEIGGGFGSFCHLLISLFPNIKKYYYIDICPNIYTGTQYLKIFFDEVYDYNYTSKKNSITFSNNDNREIYCIPSWEISKLSSKVDLF